ncbi:WD40/YVTN/BNR-like repeat-containing protein [Marinobacterium sedimentorum]|uniref:WD40/YVTN/BNR-like repeat-containing protein n=1 Tax=Marinobacterium sedimentorum TaxID=2927804 RepID=UPI0020C5CB4D|nr:glycosyl hydrolase [Marinobacterium sedimentorum]MCP8689986.1 glycosyl hydrolase [Marinobacterium sedimentorum]
MRTPVGIAVSLIVALAGIFAFSHRDTPSLGPHQIPVADMNLTSLTQTGAGLVTAGELGNILVSLDQGTTWNQASLSHQRHALITRLHFRDRTTGIAIGHEGWILRTTDGGKSWQEVAFNPGGEPLLSVNQLPSGIWMAIGAFALTMISADDGQNWSQLPPPNGTDWHLNALLPSRDHRTWLIVGEAGTVLRSTDGGENWASIPEFYNGSFYGGVNIEQDAWVIYGMRGNIFRSEDNGASWTSIGGDLPASLFAHRELANGDLVLGGQGGVLLRSEDHGRSFHFVKKSGRMTITDIVRLGSGELLMSSDSGLMPMIPATQLEQRSGA